MPKGGRLEMNDEGDISLLSNASLSKLSESYSKILDEMEKKTTKEFNRLSDAVKAKIVEMSSANAKYYSQSEATLKSQLKSIAGYNEEVFSSFYKAKKAELDTAKSFENTKKEEQAKYFKAGEKLLVSHLNQTTALERQQTLREMKDKEKGYVDQQKLLQKQLSFQMIATTRNIQETNAEIAKLDAVASDRELTSFEKMQRRKLITKKEVLEKQYTMDNSYYKKSLDNTRKAESMIESITKRQSPAEMYKERGEKIKELGENQSALISEKHSLKTSRKTTSAQLKQLEAAGQGESDLAKYLHQVLAEIDDNIKKNGTEQKENSSEMRKLTKEQNKQAAKNAVSSESLGKAMKDGFKKMADSLLKASEAIDTKISTYYQYQAKMNARLQGTNKTWGDSLNMIAKNVALSPFVKQSDVVTKMQSLIESGIAYDVELRAFLGVISEDIASTFDVMKASLARMIRVQQSDSTAMRLGMEAYLTRFYNSLFSDTSYLSDQFDNVTDAIFEASARLEKAQSIEFEYAVQKWLGSLYSLGLSQQAVSQIASGLNYLGTGDVESLNGNSQLTTLFGMAASQAEGLSYSDLITNGLDASDTNKLMESMVRYLRDIAIQTKDNNVVAKSYSNILGISMSDLTVLSKIDNQTLTNISDNMMSYGDTLSELSYQTSEIAKRVHMSTIMNTLGDNALTTAALGIGDSPALYPMWWATKLFKDLTGGLPIPFVNVMGFGLDLETTVADLILTGIAGISLLGTLISSMASGGSLFGSYDLGLWGYKETNVRGTGIPQIGGKGVQMGVSQSSTATISSGSGEDIESATLSAGAQAGSEKGKTVNAEGGTEAEKTIVDVYKALFEDKLPIGLEEQILEASRDMLGLLSTTGIKTDIVKSITLPTTATVVNTPVVVIGGMSSSSSITNSSINGKSLATSSNVVSSISNISDSSMTSLQSVENVIDSTSGEEPALNVNVKSLPGIELSNIGPDAKQFMDEFTNTVLMNVIAAAISNSINQASENGEPIDLVSILNDIREYFRTQNSDVSEINNNLSDLLRKPNASW